MNLLPPPGILRLRERLCSGAELPARAKPYISVFDDYMDKVRPHMDCATGQLEGQKHTQGLGTRNGGSMLMRAAFAWSSSASRYHRDPDMLAFLENGLRGAGQLHEERDYAGWGSGWDVEGPVFALVFCWEAIDAELRDRLMVQLAVKAERCANGPVSGSLGNQSVLQAYVSILLGILLDRKDVEDVGRDYWAREGNRVMDASGEVIEKTGACHNYSFTCFSYAWMITKLLDDPAWDERIQKCLKWILCRHTRSLNPMPPSTRVFSNDDSGIITDILPALEDYADTMPGTQEIADRILAVVKTRITSEARQPGFQHLGSCIIWAAVFCQSVSKTGDALTPPFEQRYRELTAFGRGEAHPGQGALDYVLVHRQGYQTHYSFTDHFPMSGIQTWACEAEPPIVSPTVYFPSTTVGMGLDTARMMCSRNWPSYGSGGWALAADYQSSDVADGVGRLLARYSDLWRLVFFTDVSTVILELGLPRERTTFFTLNRTAPAGPEVNGCTVTFAGRCGRLISSVASPKVVEQKNRDDGSAVQLVYKVEGPALFALTGDDFTFGGVDDLSEDSLEFTFTDASGEFNVALPPSFFETGGYHPDPYVMNRAVEVRKT